MNRSQHAIVVGGGVAGLCTAYYLRRRGFEVTIVEAATIGAPVASSYANGGWICPVQADPLPEPGLTVYGLRALLKKDSSLYFKPRYLPHLLPWLVRFWTCCNERDFRHGAVALATLGRGVFGLLDEMVASGLNFELHKSGNVIAGSTAAVVRRTLAKLEPMRAFGYEIPDKLLGRDELHALEPALSASAKFGFLVQEQWHVRADSFTTSLGVALAKMGVRLVENAAVTDFVVKDRRVQAASTAARAVRGDLFVLCAGSWTTQLVRKLGVRIPLEAGKGYTFMIAPHPTPGHSLSLPEIHVGVTPLTGGVRIGGTMEFSGFDLNVDVRRIETVFRRVAKFLNISDQVPMDAWAGLRPTVADGLPILDRIHGYTNAYIGTGYSMLGMTLSPPAGDALAEFIATGERPAVLDPFRIDRFRWFRRARAAPRTAATGGASALSGDREA